MDYVGQLEKVLDANYRIISMESDEVERIIELFRQLARQSSRAMYLWSAQEGLHRIGASHVALPRTQTAREMLEHIQNTNHYGVYLLPNLGAALAEKKTVNLLRSIATGSHPKVLVLLGEDIDLPAELLPFTLRSRHQLRRVG